MEGVLLQSLGHVEEDVRTGTLLVYATFYLAHHRVVTVVPASGVEIHSFSYIMSPVQRPRVMTYAVELVA